MGCFHLSDFEGDKGDQGESRGGVVEVGGGIENSAEDRPNQYQGEVAAEDANDEKGVEPHSELDNNSGETLGVGVAGGLEVTESVQWELNKAVVNNELSHCEDGVDEGKADERDVPVR